MPSSRGIVFRPSAAEEASQEALKALAACMMKFAGGSIQYTSPGFGFIVEAFQSRCPLFPE